MFLLYGQKILRVRIVVITYKSLLLQAVCLTSNTRSGSGNRVANHFRNCCRCNHLCQSATSSGLTSSASKPCDVRNLRTQRSLYGYESLGQHGDASFETFWGYVIPATGSIHMKCVCVYIFFKRSTLKPDRSCSWD